MSVDTYVGKAVAAADADGRKKKAEERERERERERRGGAYEKRDTLKRVDTI